MNNQASVIPNFVSVSDLQRNYSELLKQLKKSQKPLLVLKNNALEAVMLTPEAYKVLQEKIAKYEEKDVLELVKAYKREKKTGKLMKIKNVEELFE